MLNKKPKSNIPPARWSNLILSYTNYSDKFLADKGHKFLGAVRDEEGNEVHVFQRKGKSLANA